MRPSDKIILYDEYNQNLDFQRVLTEYFRSDDPSKILGNNLLFDEMKQVDTYQEHLGLHTFGIAGGGKSVITNELLNLNCAIDHKNPEFHLDYDKPEYIINNVLNPEWDKQEVMVSYDWTELINLMKTWGKYGTYFWSDEAPIPHGKNSRIILDMFENLARVAMRKFHLRVIILNPFLLDLTSMNWFLQIIGTKRDSWLTIGLLYSNQMVLKAVVLLPIRLLFINGNKLHEEYERMSAIRKNAIREQGGYSAVYTSEEIVDKMALEFYNFCRQRGAETKEDLKGFVEIYKPMANFPAKSAVITKVKTILKFPDLKEQVLPTLFNKNDVPSDETDETNSVPEPQGTFDDPQVVTNPQAPKITLAKFAFDFMQKNHEIQSNCLIMEGYFGGKTVDQIGSTQGLGISGARVSQLLGTEGHLADRFSGDIWESYYVKEIEGIEAITGGNIPIPDIIEYQKEGQKHNWYLTKEGYSYIEHHEDYDSRFGKVLDIIDSLSDRPSIGKVKLDVFSLKCRNKNVKTDPYNIATEKREDSDCYPEWHFCCQNNIPYFHFGYVNLKWDAKLFRKKDVPINALVLEMSRFKENLILKET